MDTLVSIIIPVYNGANYLRGAIDSALSQTYANVEIIVVNDGSTDDSESIALSYGSKIRYFYKSNGGVSTALNLGIKEMRGDYFSWLSHDDEYYPYRIEEQISALKRDGDMTKIVYGDWEIFDESDNSIKQQIFKDIASEEKLSDSIYPVIRGFLQGCEIMIHKSHFERVGVFDENLRCIQDTLMWFKLFRSQRLIYINRILTRVRHHANQVSITQSDKVAIEQEWYYLFLLESITVEEQRRIFGSSLWYLFRMWGKFINRGFSNDRLYEDIQRESQKYRNCIAPILPDFSEIYIFPTGMECKSYYHLFTLLGIAVKGFIDNDKRKQGKVVINELLCYDISEIEKSKTIFVSGIFRKEISNQLNGLGYGSIITDEMFEKALAQTESNCRG